MGLVSRPERIGPQSSMEAYGPVGQFFRTMALVLYAVSLGHILLLETHKEGILAPVLVV